MLNDIQIESAARALCQARGLDAELVIALPDDPFAAVPARSSYVPTWQCVAAEIRKHEATAAAIAAA